MDRTAYKREMQSLVGATRGLEVIDAAVEDLVLTSNEGGPAHTSVARVVGVKLDTGVVLRAPTTVIATGTFLRGVIRVGSKPPVPAGRAPTALTEKPDAAAASAANALAARLYGAGFAMGRMKTGTPPRLDKSSIDWSDERLTPQPGDAAPSPFSFENGSGPGPPGTAPVQTADAPGAVPRHAHESRDGAHRRGRAEVTARDRRGRVPRTPPGELTH